MQTTTTTVRLATPYGPASAASAALAAAMRRALGGYVVLAITTRPTPPQVAK